MKNSTDNRIELTEIADYRGNLSFAEENNPIPFDINCVFWTTISKDCSFKLSTKAFLIALDGEINIKTTNGNLLLDRPNQGFIIDSESDCEVSLVSSSAILLLVMNQRIERHDESLSLANNILQMPSTTNFCGLNGFFANANTSIPFDIKRVYFTYDIPNFSKRGGHAHIYTQEIVFPIKGKFDVTSEDNSSKKRVHLSQENQGIFLNTGIWRELENFADKSLVLVIASEPYYEADYIREYDDFEVQYKK